VQPRILSVSLRDAAGQDISNVATVTCDSRSVTLEERKKIVPLILKPGRYDKHQSYFLVLRDAETEVEYLRVQMTIDIAFTNDF
jgi:hypothetical protein